ncbi:MAG: hypothetical protein GKR91_14625 [Pseudomonadales bacterium]|nr:hypothetical protein [Pseudomonadales bacterium]
MACYNHPNAPTAAHCNRCGLEMCGQCTQFLDHGEYCEKCSEILYNEEFVNAQSKELNRPEPNTVQRAKQEVDTFVPPTRDADKDKMFIWFGVGGSSAMIFVAMVLYSFPLLFEGAEAAAYRVAEQSLEDCRLVFEEIGYVLEDGQTPPQSMRCPETNVPNIVSSQGGIVQVSHPNPQVHELSEIYVTSESHEVVYVD